MTSEAVPRPILVTGSNRSGTTWVGRTMALSHEVTYLHEPFNPSLRLPRLDADVPGHYTYVCRENEGAYLEPMRKLLRYRPPIKRQLRNVRSVDDLARVVRHASVCASGRFRRRRPLLKDPIALFSTPWLAERFDMDVVVMIRHPAAYASSISRLGWTYDFSFLLSQELLLRDYLGEFRSEVQRHALDPQPPLEQAILLWKLMYTVVERFRHEHPTWAFVRHEDLSAAPVDGFRQLFATTGLPFDRHIASQIDEATGAHNPSERPVSERHDVRRDSRAASQTWLSRLSSEEIEHVRVGVGSIADCFYSDEEWAPAG